MRINNFVPDSKIFEGIGSNKETDAFNNGNNDFFSMLKSKLDEINDKQISADDETQKFVSGEDTDIHNVMLSTEEAKMSLELAVQVRNKIVDAYQEINRMQL